MKNLTVVLVLLSTFNLAWALEIQFIGPCSPAPLFQHHLRNTTSLNVGDLTLDVLESFEIPYQGTSAGLHQVFATPMGLEAMEVISDHEMMAYGWCFEVDGKLPEVLSSEFKVDRKMKSITWFYGYAHYLNGQWISQCQKSYERKSPQFCPSVRN